MLICTCYYSYLYFLTTDVAEAKPSTPLPLQTSASVYWFREIIPPLTTYIMVSQDQISQFSRMIPPSQPD